MRKMIFPPDGLNPLDPILSLCSRCGAAYVATRRSMTNRRDRVCDACLAEEQEEYELRASMERIADDATQ